MDCLRPLCLTVLLTSLGTGCVGLGGKKDIVARTAPTAPPVAASVEPAPTPVSTSTKKRNPLPSTCVAVAVVREREAAKLNHDPRLQREMRDEARRAYQEALRLDPKFLPAHAGLARLYMQMEDYDRAEETFRKGLEKLPNEPGLWFDLGMCHCRRKDWTKAVVAMQKALDIDPENRHFQQTLGFTLARAGKIDEGLALLVKAVGRAEAHYNMARMLIHLDRRDEARSHLDRAIQANPQLQAAQNLLSHLTTGQSATPVVTVDLNLETPPPLVPIPQ